MHLNNLLFSLALPVASKAIDVAANAAQSVGQNFASFLSDARANSKTRVDGPHQTDTFSEDLAHYAEDLRDYIADSGVAGSFKIRFEVTPEGEQSAGVSGMAAEEVSELLSGNKTWLAELRKLAAVRQKLDSNTGGYAPHLNIEISDSATSHWQLG